MPALSTIVPDAGTMLLTVIKDYTLNNPDTLTKYKTAAQISHRVLEAVTGTDTYHFEPDSQLNSVKGGVPRARKSSQYVSAETSCLKRR